MILPWLLMKVMHSLQLKFANGWCSAECVMKCHISLYGTACATAGFSLSIWCIRLGRWYHCQNRRTASTFCGSTPLLTTKYCWKLTNGQVYVIHSYAGLTTVFDDQSITHWSEIKKWCSIPDVNIACCSWWHGKSLWNEPICVQTNNKLN